MEKMLTAYKQLSKRMPYGKDAEMSTYQLDAQDALQEAILKCLDIDVENPAGYLQQSAKNTAKNFDRYAKLEYFGEVKDGETEQVYIDEQLMTLKDALKARLDAQEYEIFTLYGEGYTLQEIADLKGLATPMTVKRILHKASTKVEKMGIAYWIDSKFATYQGKAGKVQVTYPDHKEPAGLCIQRKYLCIDQSKPKSKTLPLDYNGDMVPLRKRFEVKRELTYTSHDSRDEVTYFEGNGYHNSITPDICRNSELIAIMHNRAIVTKQDAEQATVVKENRYKIQFNYGKHIDTTGKYKDIE